jgi:hypothetical protein
MGEKPYFFKKNIEYLLHEFFSLNDFGQTRLTLSSIGWYINKE